MNTDFTQIANRLATTNTIADSVAKNVKGADVMSKNLMVDTSALKASFNAAERFQKSLGNT